MAWLRPIGFRKIFRAGFARPGFLFLLVNMKLTCVVLFFLNFCWWLTHLHLCGFGLWSIALFCYLSCSLSLLFFFFLTLLLRLLLHLLLGLLLLLLCVSCCWALRVVCNKMLLVRGFTGISAMPFLCLRSAVPAFLFQSLAIKGCSLSSHVGLPVSRCKK